MNVKVSFKGIKSDKKSQKKKTNYIISSTQIRLDIEAIYGIPHIKNISVGKSGINRKIK